MKTQTRTEMLVANDISAVNHLEVLQAKERAAEAAEEIANAKKFWSLWSEDDRSSKIWVLNSRARKMQVKAEELAKGKLEAEKDFTAIVMTYVTAIRELSGNHFAI